MALPRPRPLQIRWTLAEESRPNYPTTSQDLLLSRAVCTWLEISRRRLKRTDSSDDEGPTVQDWSRIGLVLERGEDSSDTELLSSAEGIRRGKGKGLERVVCWGRVDEGLQDPEEAELTVTVPPSLIAAYPQIFAHSEDGISTGSLLLRPTTPLPLHTLFLRALSSSAYELAKAKPELVLEKLVEVGGVVRQAGEVGFSLTEKGEKEGYTNGHGSSHLPQDSAGIDPEDGQREKEGFRYAYSVLLCEPVLQGLITGSSQLYVLPPSDAAEEVEEEDEDETPTQSIYRERSRSTSVSGGSSRSRSTDRSGMGVNGIHRAGQWGMDEQDDDDQQGEEDEELEIDASFLAASLPPLPPPTPVLQQGNGEPNALSASISSLASLSSSKPTLEFAPIPLPWKPDSICSPVHGQGHGQGEERVYLRPKDLARLGVFSGDWVLLRPSASFSGSPPKYGGPSPSRLARAYASDLVPSSPSSGAGLSLLASPTLLHSFPPSHPLSPAPTLSVQPTPFHSLPPPLPLSQTVTLARIASPQSTSKAYQPLFLRALRRQFEGGRRVVREGEVLGVVVRSGERGLLRAKEGEEEGEVDDTLLDYSFPFSSSQPDTPIFFKITHIAYDPPPSSALYSVSPPISSPSLSPSSGGPVMDVYTAATLGELGCWFDSSKTRMVQSGIENSLVPDLLLPGPLTSLPNKPPGEVDDTMPYGKLLQLCAACLSPSAMEYDLQLCVLLRGQRGVGKVTTASSVARRLWMHTLVVNCYDLVGESDVKTEGTLRARFEAAGGCAPCMLVLKGVEALGRVSQVLEQGKEPAIATVLRECIASLSAAWKETGFPIILVATSSEAEKLPLSVQACFKHEITFASPGETERHEILQALLDDDLVAPDVDLREVASQSAALVAKDLVDLVRRARLGALERATRELKDADASADEIDDAGIALSGADFTAALAESRASYSESIGAPKIPNVSWDDVGGLAEVKADILDTIQLPLEHPELFADGLKKRSGILLYGPPGTGKTLLAKAVATSCSLNFFSVKGPELLNMYIGESEANVRRVFQRARDARPCVIFFDELDSVAPKRGNHGDSGGVMDRIVSQLLAELDGMSDGSSSAEVFVIGATNRPDLLDPALLRPGRFDRMLYLGVSTNHDAQLKILQALTRKFRLDPTLDLMRVAEQCPFNYTGADFYALCSDAMLKAMTRKAEETDVRIAEWNSKEPVYGHLYPMTPQYYLAELATPEETDFLVSQRDFEAALSELVPSVTANEMEHYAAVQKKFARDTINSEANLDRKGKGKGKAKAIELPEREDEQFGEHARLADEID